MILKISREEKCLRNSGRSMNGGGLLGLKYPAAAQGLWRFGLGLKDDAAKERFVNRAGSNNCQ
jgi:hypothetical protein